MSISDGELKWLQDLQRFLNVTLEPIFPKDETRYKYIGPTQMAIWGKAFTHETVSPSNNYEDLEYLGDMVLKYVFPKYMMKRLPHFHKSQYTELNVAYMSKMYQGQLAKEMGLSDYVRVQGLDRVILNIEADVFESFFGALDQVSDTVIPGIGANNCYKMIHHLFENREIDETKGAGSPKTQVIQIFSRFELSKIKDVIDDGNQKLVQIVVDQQIPGTRLIPGDLLGEAMSSKENVAESLACKDAINVLNNFGIIRKISNEIKTKNIRGVRFQVILNQDHINFLRARRINIPNSIIGDAIAPTAKEAEAESYKQALNTLSNYGVNTKWAEHERLNIDMSSPEVAPYVNKANEILHREGFTRMYFFIPRKTVTPKGAVVQLVGIRPNGNHEILAYMYATDEDRKTGFKTKKGMLVKYYSEKYYSEK